MEEERELTREEMDRLVRFFEILIEIDNEQKIVEKDKAGYLLSPK